MQYIFCILKYLIYISDVENMKMKLGRVAMKLSQQELADRCEVTRQTIGLIEKGSYNPTLKLCIRIAHELNLTLNDLFWDEKEQSTHPDG